MCVTTILQSILYYFNIPHTDIVGNSGQTPKKESTREMLSNNKSQGGHWRIQTQQDTGQPAAATVLQCYSNNSFEARMTSCSSSASHLLHLSLSHKHTYFQPGPSQHYCRYPDFSPRTALIMTLLCWDEEGENGFWRWTGCDRRKVNQEKASEMLSWSHWGRCLNVKNVGLTS